MANLIMNGRNITLDEYLEGRKEYDGLTKKEQDQLVKDRDTFNIYRGDSSSDDESGESEDSHEDNKREQSSDEESSESEEAQSSSSATPVPAKKKYGRGKFPRKGKETAEPAAKKMGLSQSALPNFFGQFEAGRNTTQAKKKQKKRH